MLVANSYTTHDGYFSMQIDYAANEIIRDRISDAILPSFQENSADMPLQLYVIANPESSITEGAYRLNAPSILSVSDGLRLYDLSTSIYFENHGHFVAIDGVYTDELLFRKAVSNIYPAVRDFVGQDVDMIVELHLYNKEIEAMREHMYMSWTEGKTFELPPPEMEGGSVHNWFADAMEERYFKGNR